MKANKILLKHLLPTFLTAGTVITAMTGVIFYAGAQEIKDNKEVRAQDVFMTAVVFGGLALLILPLIDSYKSSNKFASKTARKYIKQIMQEHPELKDFDSVLTNQQALKSITTMISNSLRPEEQKRVLNIITRVQQYVYRSTPDAVIAMQAAQKEIIQILQEHAAVHPNFVTEIYAAMAYADTTYVIPARQNVR